jgi:5-formyltetrahydrofolate cyclo-ligase
MVAREAPAGWRLLRTARHHRPVKKSELPPDHEPWDRGDMTIDVPPSPVAAKAMLRREALARRAALPEAHRAAAAAVIAAAADALEVPQGAVVSGFVPVKGEIDVLPLLDRLAARGHPLALPVVVGPTELVFRRWRPAEPLEEAGFGLFHPSPEAGLVDPDVLLVPLAAFDRRGHRIGYGRGYYDRALARLDAKGRRHAVGVAFAVQEVPLIPDEPHDRRLDALLTEDGLRATG